MLIEHCLSWPDLDGVEHDFEIVFDGDPATGAELGRLEGYLRDALRIEN